MRAQQTLLGERLRLFTDGSGTPAPCLVISSHGAYVPGRNERENEGNGWMAVPVWTTLGFYVPHGVVLEDPGIGNISRHEPTEKYGPRTMVRNYRLFKYQGSHGSRSETYDSIREGIDGNRDLAVLRDRERSAASQAALDSGFLEPVVRYDALTIRHRFRGAFSAVLGVTLRDVLRELDQHGHRYPLVCCCFCRSSLLGGKPWTGLNQS